MQAEQPVIVNDRRGVREAEDVKVPGGVTPIGAPPVTQVFAPNRRQVLAAFSVGKKILVDGVVFHIRKVTDKDIVLRPMWVMPVKESA
jgi:hypothetical protein